MISLEGLPAVNACFNGASASCLVLGYVFIRRGNRRVHRAFMLAALAASTLFLVGYLTYHAQVGTTRFLGEGVWRPIYFSILTSHTILAAAVVPLAAITLFRAHKGLFDRHRRVARWTLPVWLYVSVTGVLIYFMLYQWFPHHTGG